MLKIKSKKRFDKDYKRIKKKELPTEELWKVVQLLQSEVSLPLKYQDHKLENDGKYRNVRECHIRPDWLLIYAIEKKELVLMLIRTGTHSDLF